MNGWSVLGAWNCSDKMRGKQRPRLRTQLGWRVGLSIQLGGDLLCEPASLCLISQKRCSKTGMVGRGEFESSHRED